MQDAKRKLHSKRGASIVIALLFFLVCLTVGGVMLTAATANAGRLSHLRSDQQEYFLLSSAAALLRDDISGARYEIVEKQQEDGKPKPEFPEIESKAADTALKDVRLRKSLDTWVKAVYIRDLSQNDAKSFQISYEKEIVYGTLYMYGDEAANKYSIEAYFDLRKEGEAPPTPDRTHYRMRLYIPAEVSSLTETSREMDAEGAEKETVKTTITITWGDGIISKAKETANEPA